MNIKIEHKAIAGTIGSLRRLSIQTEQKDARRNWSRLALQVTIRLHFWYVDWRAASANWCNFRLAVLCLLLRCNFTHYAPRDDSQALRADDVEVFRHHLVLPA